MELLLDTHTFLWWLADDRKLGAQARAAIAEAANTVYVSAASAWEIAVKRASGKLEAPGDVRAWIADNGFSDLPVGVEHENLVLVAHDDEIGRYGAPMLEARA